MTCYKGKNKNMVKPEVYRALGLRDEDYRKILRILKREPTPTELAMFSVEWSEHCGYSHSKALLKTLPKTGKYKTLIGEDSGGFLLGDKAIVFKMESHNHPSQVEPKQGAATGIGGIIRDIFTAGARPIACLDSLRFGPLSEPYNRYLLKGVVDGIQFYGNCVGVPTVGGEIYFDDCYSGNCLVNAMCIGVADKDKLARARAYGLGNAIIYVGSSTGKDGIGGCSVLASQEFAEDDEKRPSVQIGDPFTEKCLIEATLEAIDTDHVVGIKDMGAAGLTCSTSEMAAAGESGVEIELQLVPRREANMQPWEVMMSESQERMLVCVKKGREKEILDIFHKWDLNAVVIGRVIDEKVVRVKDNGKTVAEIPPDALANAPLCSVGDVKPKGLDETTKLDIKDIKEPADYNDALLELLSSPTIANKRWVYEQYDHMVQTNTTVLPGSDAAVLRLKGTKKAIAAATDCNSRYCRADPYRGAQIAVAEAARNLACSGAEPAAVTDCLNFGNPEKGDRFWHFKNCIKGIAEACRFFNIAVVSGNVSFYNESPKGAVYPTPTIGIVGVIDDAGKACTQSFKKNGDIIALIGETKEELGASEYLKAVHGLAKGGAPELDLKLERAVQKTVLEAIRKCLINSAHDCSEGGIAVALAECCISGEKPVGAEVNLEDDIRPDALLFGETQSRIIVSCAKSKAKGVAALARKNKVPFKEIGITAGDKLKVKVRRNKLIDLPLTEAAEAWQLKIPSV